VGFNLYCIVGRLYPGTLGASKLTCDGGSQLVCARCCRYSRRKLVQLPDIAAVCSVILFLFFFLEPLSTRVDEGAAFAVRVD